MRNIALPRRRQRGAIAVMFVVMLVGVMGMIGLALDLALVYNRKAELQALADATALAAARSLNGEVAGITNALTQATLVANNHTYQYGKLPFGWSSSALRFSTAADTPDAGWMDAAAAKAAPANVLFAKVDIGQLDAEPRTISTVLIGVVSSELTTATTSARAVAGRASVNVLPLAICAQSATPAASRANVAGNAAYNELVEYGFRRGVSYDLMKLSPSGTAAENFLIDPLSPPGTTGSAAHLTAAVAAPFVCNGSMPMASVKGGTITVLRGFPIGALHDHLNSRLDLYSGNACAPEAAPPDTNVKQYPPAGAVWMQDDPEGQTAAEWTSNSTRLWTVADPLPGAASTPPKYGPLWAYSRAVPYSAYSASVPEPVGGYAAPFSVTAWSRLYTPNPPIPDSYPSALATSTPYSTVDNPAYFDAPDRPGLAKRRVLNVALLSCPVGAGSVASATVLAVGRFFMTVAATNDAISAEFAGTAAQSTLTGAVELQR